MIAIYGPMQVFNIPKSKFLVFKMDLILTISYRAATISVTALLKLLTMKFTQNARICIIGNNKVAYLPRFIISGELSATLKKLIYNV